MGGQQPVAEAVDGGDAQTGKVPAVTRRSCDGADAFSHLMGGGAGEGAEQQVLGLHLAGEKQIEGSEADADRLAGPGSGQDEQGSVSVGDDGQLLLVERLVQTSNGGRDGHDDTREPGRTGSRPPGRRAAPTRWSGPCRRQRPARSPAPLGGRGRVQPGDG